MEIPNDPFLRHFRDDLSDELLVSLSDTNSTIEQTIKNWPILGDLSITLPKPIQTSRKKIKTKICLIEEKPKAALGAIPNTITKVEFNSLNIKQQIQGNIVAANKNNLIKKDLDLTEIFTPLQKELFAIINNYQDLYYPERTLTNADDIRFIYCLHVVNHMLKTRIKILHHNAKLSRKLDTSDTDEYRDQGLVRPKVIIIYL